MAKQTKVDLGGEAVPAEELGFEIEKEPWSIYRLEDGTVISPTQIVATGKPCAFARMSEVGTQERRFLLRSPIDVKLSFENGLWLSEFGEFSILAFGQSPAEALVSFREDFAALWEEIAQCPDEQLTPEALRVKDSLLRAVQSVTEERESTRHTPGA